MIQNHILTVHENGDITTLWTDEIPLHTLGDLNIARASTIEFNHTSQLWEVCFAGDTTPVYFNRSRSACIAWEIETINAKLAAEPGAACPIPPRLAPGEHNAFPNGRWS